MNVVLARLGTDGDIFPHSGLGARLLVDGHRAILAAPQTYRGRTEAIATNFCPLVTADDVQRMLEVPNLWHLS